jgi:hypothetical protein
LGLGVTRDAIGVSDCCLGESLVVGEPAGDGAPDDGDEDGEHGENGQRRGVEPW